MTNNITNIWQEFANEIGGKFIEGYSWHSDKTEIEYNNWKITFDNFTIWSGKHSTEVTRVIVPFISVDKFQFEIYKNGFVRTIEKLFGAQDITIGRDDFDKAFIIKANNELKIKSLLQSQKIRDLISSQKEVNIQISNQKGIWEEKLPKREFELSFYTNEEIKDIEELKSLLQLFKEMLDGLNQMKSIEIIPMQ
jgi:hypothetical protein